MVLNDEKLFNNNNNFLTFIQQLVFHALFLIWFNKTILSFRLLKCAVCKQVIEERCR